MLSALLRLWDENKRAVSMVSIANSLEDRRIIDALAADYEAQWHHNLRVYRSEDRPEELHSEIAAAAQGAEADIGREEASILRQRAAEAVAIIREYEKGGSKRATLESLKRLRNERL